MHIRFGPFTLDRDTRQLLEGTREVHLAPKAFDLLSMLVAERPRLLSKAVLQERLWPGSFVVEANLANLIAEIRGALRDRARAPRFIRTKHGYGYAFCGDATTVEGRQTEAGPLRCWLEHGRQRFPLSSGPHVVGRAPDVAIRLDGSTVSRLHAQLLVSDDRTVLEDFGSKNGTFRGTERVTSAIVLADGDALRFGSLLLTYHVHSQSTTTDTEAQSTP
jgi:DNA-binding winged helix-turn-helix (wHTH) protein